MHQWVMYMGLTRSSDTCTRSVDTLLLPCCPQPHTHHPITSDHTSTPDITSMMHPHLSPPRRIAAGFNLHLPCFIYLAFTQRRAIVPAP